MRNADDRDDIAINNVEDQMRSLAIAEIAFAYLVAHTSGTGVFAQPFETFCHIGEVFFGLTLTPSGEREVRNLVEILQSSRGEPIAFQVLSAFGARCLARFKTSAVEKSTYSLRLAC